jgi:hypothetical protein
VDFANLSRVLWRERELLDLLLFKLHEQHLLLVSGDVEWLPRASSEVQTVLERLGEMEFERAVEFDHAALMLGVAPAPSLRTLASAAPEPWGYLLDEHHAAFVALATRIQTSADANRDLTTAAARATEAVIAGVSGMDSSARAYASTGRPDVDMRRAHFMDTEI